MKAFVLLLSFTLTLLIMQAQNTADPIYQFTVENLYGETFELSSLEGKKIMVVNTASKCGLTPQYKDLQELYEQYKDQNFIIIGFPANNFLKQEPGTNDEIATFCSVNYGVQFPMMSKIDVRGKNTHPLYQYLTQKAQNGYADSKVKWNFQKYLIGEEGFLEMVVDPKILPNDQSVIDWIEN